MYYNPIEAGKRIQNLRKERGMTQMQMADELNISTTHLAKIEIGSRGCSLDILISIAVFLEASLDYIVFGKAHTDHTALKGELASIIDRMYALKQTL